MYTSKETTTLALVLNPSLGTDHANQSKTKPSHMGIIYLFRVLDRAASAEEVLVTERCKELANVHTLNRGRGMGLTIINTGDTGPELLLQQPRHGVSGRFTGVGASPFGRE